MVLRDVMKLACVFAVMTVPGTAFAQSQQATNERLSRIERAISDLQGVVYSVEGNQFDPSRVTGSAALPGPDSPSASMTVRISQIERELQTLTGKVEELMYKTEQNSRRLDTLTEALATINQPSNQYDGFQDGDYSGDDFGMPMDDVPVRGPLDEPRPARSGGNGGMPNDLRGGTGLPAGVDSPFPVIDENEMGIIDPDLTYNSAFDSMMAGDFAAAEEGFLTFLQEFPEDPRAADAQFRLGEIYLATNANSRAAVAFLDHIKNYPNDARAAEAYLKLGMAYNRLGKASEACQIYSVMESKFQSLSLDLQNRLSIERGKAGC